MYIANLNDLALGEFGFENDATARVKGTFPFSAVTGNKNTAMVYVEIEPGNRLATHTDSAEEIVVILSGAARVNVGRESKVAKAGQMALVPALEPHSIHNVGKETIRMLGIFSSNTVMSTFEQPLILLGAPPMSPLGERTVLTPLPVQLEQTPLAAVVA